MLDPRRRRSLVTVACSLVIAFVCGCDDGAVEVARCADERAANRTVVVLQGHGIDGATTRREGTRSAEHTVLVPRSLEAPARQILLAHDLPPRGAAAPEPSSGPGWGATRGRETEEMIRRQARECAAQLMLIDGVTSAHVLLEIPEQPTHGQRAQPRSATATVRLAPSRTPESVAAAIGPGEATLEERVRDIVASGAGVPPEAVAVAVVVVPIDSLPTPEQIASIAVGEVRALRRDRILMTGLGLLGLLSLTFGALYAHSCLARSERPTPTRSPTAEGAV